MEAATAAGTRGRLARWTFLAGVLYVVLFLIGTIMIYGDQPDSSSAPAKIIAYYSDGGHRDRVNAGWILISLAVFFLIWFVAALRRAVAAVDAERIVTGVVAIGGTVYVAVTFAAVAVEQGLKTMSDDTYQHRVFPELVHAADDVSWVMHASGAIALGAMIIASSLAFMWSGIWPKAAGWVGVVVGILALGSVAFFPQFLFLLWILAVSVFMFRRESRLARA